MLLEAPKEEHALELLTDASGENRNHAEHRRVLRSAGRELFEGIGRDVVQAGQQPEQPVHDEPHHQEDERHQGQAQREFARGGSDTKPHGPRTLAVRAGQGDHQGDQHDRVREQKGEDERGR